MGLTKGILKMAKSVAEAATDEEISFLKECFYVENGQVFWRTDRPDSHFYSVSIANAWRSRHAGTRAGKRDDGRNVRVTFATEMRGKKINRSEDWVLIALLGELPKPAEAFGFAGVMAAMNKFVLA